MKIYVGILSCLVLLSVKATAIEGRKESIKNDLGNKQSSIKKYKNEQKEELHNLEKSKIQPLEPPIKTLNKLKTNTEVINQNYSKTKQTPNTTQDILNKAKYYQKVLEFLGYKIIIGDKEYKKREKKIEDEKVQEEYRKYFTKHFRVVCQYFVSRFQNPTPPLTWGTKPDFKDYLMKQYPVLYKYYPIPFSKEKEVYDLFRTLINVQWVELSIGESIFLTAEEKKKPFNPKVFKALQKLNPHITQELFMNTASLILFHGASYFPPPPPSNDE